MKNQYYLFVFLGLISIRCTESEHPHLVSREIDVSSILIQDVDIFNGRDATLLFGQDVHIKEGRIVEIGKDISIENQDNVTLIDGKSRVLMPGLIDAHVHLSGSGAVPWDKSAVDLEYNLSAYLYAGITTVYDLGGMAKQLKTLAEKVKSKEVIGPSIYHTHLPITVKNSHPIPLAEQMVAWPLKTLLNTLSPTINEPNEAPKLIESYLKNEIDYVKIICDQIPPESPEMVSDQLEALIAEAHGHDKKVFVHVGSPENAVTAVMAGADILAHGVWRGKLTEDQADVIARSNTPIIYTLAGFQNVILIYTGSFIPNEEDSLLVPQEILDPVAGENGLDVRNQKVMSEFFKDVVQKAPFWHENFRLLHERGVKILVGTDSNLPGTYAGATYYQELDELKRFGLSNFEILTAATYLNANAFLDEPEFGLIDVGKQANLLLINGNPLEDLEKLKDIELIVLHGDIIRREQ